MLGIDTSRPPRATAFEKFKLNKQGMEGFTSEDPLTIGVIKIIMLNYIYIIFSFVGTFWPILSSSLETIFINHVSKMLSMLTILARGSSGLLVVSRQIERNFLPRFLLFVMELAKEWFQTLVFY